MHPAAVVLCWTVKAPWPRSPVSVSVLGGTPVAVDLILKEPDPEVTPLLSILTSPTLSEVTVILLLLSIFPRSSRLTIRFLLIIVVMVVLPVN